MDEIPQYDSTPYSLREFEFEEDAFYLFCLLLETD